MKDRAGNEFTTRFQNVFVIGNGNKEAISLPKNKGLRISIIEERDKKLAPPSDKKAKKSA